MGKNNLKYIFLPLAVFFSLLFTLISCGSEKYEYENENEYKVGEFNKTVFVSTLDIEWISGSVELVGHNGSGFYTAEESELPIGGDHEMRIWFDGGILRIRPSASGIKKDKIPEKKLTVYIPMENLLSFNDVDIDTDSANITIDQIGAGFFEINTLSGNVSLGHFGNSRDVKISTVSGSIEYTHTLGKSESTSVNTSSGTVRIGESKPSDVLNINSASGSIELTLPENSGFTLEAVTVSGIKSNAFQGTMSGGKLVVGDGKSKISIGSASGNIAVKKNK